MNLALRFAWPAALWGVLLVPLALVAYLALQRRAGGAARRFGNPALLPNLVSRQPGWRRHVPTVLYLFALAGLLAALARPQATFAMPREQATVVLVMDTSVSMGATDVQPSRLAAADAAAQRFLDQLPAPLRVALVSFANSPQVLAGPTTDRAAVRRALDAMRAGGGTAMGDALQLAVGLAASTESASPTAVPTAPTTGAGAAGEGPPAAILLLSDGANTAGQAQPLDAAALARQRGIPVYTIALGTPSGTIESPDAPGSGQLMAVPPDEATLQQVAQLTGGQFFRAPTAADLHAVYQQIGSRVGYVQQEQEVTAAFLAAGAALLAAGGGLALLWFNRFP